MVTESFAARGLAEIRSAITGKLVYKDREVLALLEEPLQRLKAATPEERLEFVFEALSQTPSADFLLQGALKAAAGSMLRNGVPLNSVNAVRLVELISYRRVRFPHKAVLAAIEDVAMTPALAEALTQLRSTIDEWIGGTEMRELHKRIDTLLQGSKEEPVAPVAAWSRHVFQELAKSPKQFEWHALFLHARSLTQSSASKKWMTEAQALVNKIGPEEVLDSARRWLALGPTPGVTQEQTPEAEADYQKGFVWALGALGDASIASDIADFAFACFRKIPMIGAVSHKAGNACVNALAVMPGLDAVSQISRLAARIKYDVAKRLIEKALEEAAARNNVSREDLEAMSVPTFGLNVEGVRMETAGDCEAVLLIEDGDASLKWTRDGKALKSVPASIKADHAELLDEMKKAAKELGTTLGTQRIRLERMLLSESACAFARWKEWYLDNPVVSYFASRLIWEFEENASRWTAIPFKGRFVDWAGNPVTPAADANVRLWHPMRSELQEVLSWRCWLEDHGVRQPFKQAHREVYILTDAERQTRDHSNRFAAHILKQHQFSALCRERGWQFNLMGQWDSHNTPTLDLPRHKLRVELDVDFPRDEDEDSGHAIFLAIRTGAVRFSPIPEKQARGLANLDVTNIPAMLAELQKRMPRALPLESIPPVVFSEVMRDIDLFVGVTSIGADPAWNPDWDNDPSHQAHHQYWRNYAFGELTASAENRGEIVAALLPKLAIRDRCRIDGRFLVVRGDLHEYRIHLGSGNVIREPGSRYLCIVQGAGDTAANLQLPFEGDRILSVILSKAFLLAADSKIKDETIRRQL